MSTIPAALSFHDSDGNPVAIMDVFAEADGAGPFRVSPEEALENGESEFQLMEAAAYEYEIKKEGYCLREQAGLVRTSRAPNARYRGRLTPGLNVGRLRLDLLSCADGRRAGSADVEVRAAKVSYRDEYRRMLEYITIRCTDLLLEFRSPAEQSVLPEDAREPETICQRFAFVRSLVTSRRFRDAVQRVVAMPHRLWEQVEEQVPLGRGVKPSASVARQIASASRRIPLSIGHPLAHRMASVPDRVTIFRNVETIDTAENRFIKHALRTFQAFAANVRERLEETKRDIDARFIEEAEALEEELGETLNRDFFRSLAEPVMLPLGSPVLQRKGGYREILAAWLQFDMAARLHWKGGDNVYGAGKRDVATLYEYWLFFKLLEVVAAIFHLSEPQAGTLIEATDDGLGLKLQSGRHIPLEGEYIADGGGRRIRVRFSFNRTFSRKGPDAETNFPEAGSWTERMRPDYTLTLWPADFSETEAERQEVIVHVHFDAKYRVKDIAEMFGEADEDLSDEAALHADLARDKEAQKEGRYKRADLLKMHAYKDAIRRTAGAYVLYPGTQNRQWRGFHEIVPGLGAFGIRPCEDAEDGTAALKEFILQVVQHVCDRATRREQETYHRYRIQDTVGPPPLAVRESLAEYDMAGRRARPPRETPVLVGWYENESQLRWTDEHERIVFRVISDGKRGAVPLTPDNVGAYYILLHTKGQQAAPGLYAVKCDDNGNLISPEVISAATLRRRHRYPVDTRSDYYLVYRVESAAQFAMTRWNIRQILTRRGIAEIASPLPFTATLDEVMNCAY